MILAPRTLLALLVLAPYTTTSNSSSPADAALNLQDPTKTPQIPQIASVTFELFLDSFDYNATDVLDMGAKLKSQTLNTDMETIVTILDKKLCHFAKQGHKASTPERIKEKLDCFAKQGYDISAISNIEEPTMLIMQRISTAAGVMLHGFLADSNLDIVSLVKTALISHSFNLLRTLTTLYVWSSPEQFHWFQALGYKSDWYDEKAWNDNPVPMDWSKNLTAIFEADNPILLNDLVSGIFSENHLILNNEILFDLIAKHDSLNIYQSLSPTPAINLEILAGSGSFKLLRILAESQSIDLHLEDYHPPHTLPRDFEFFWMQGYRYLPVPRLLSMACKHGRDDILEFLYRLNPSIMDPMDYLELAAENGHLNVLNWALTHTSNLYSKSIGSKLITHGHLEIYEQLQKKLKLSRFEKHNILDNAVENDRLDIVKWAYGKFDVVPSPQRLGRASIKMLEWVKSVDPQVINEELAEYANLSILKWILKNHPHLLTARVKSVHNCTAMDLEKAQWMVSQSWQVHPDLSLAAHKGKTEILEFGYNNLHMKPTREHATNAAQSGHIKVLELIYRIDSSCINQDSLLEAVEHEHLESAKYLESILNLKGSVLDFPLCKAFNSGNLELIEWVYQNYKLEQFHYYWVRQTIECGHLHVFDWVLDKGFVLKTNDTYLIAAARYGQHLIFQRLISYGMPVTNFKDYISPALYSESLGMIKYLVGKDFESVQVLKDISVSAHNYHIVQWLQDNNLWEQ